jgi:hypothetical protein
VIPQLHFQAWTLDFRLRTVFSAFQRDDVQVIRVRPDPGATVREGRDVIEGYREARDGGCGGRVFDDRFQPPGESARKGKRDGSTQTSFQQALN